MTYLPLANILHHKLRSVMSALGIGIGICMLVTLSGLARGSLFEITLRSRGQRMAFIDLGDQFIALIAGREQPADTHRHFGLVVDEPEAVREAAAAAGATMLPSALRISNWNAPGN